MRRSRISPDRFEPSLTDLTVLGALLLGALAFLWNEVQPLFAATVR